MLSLQFTMGDGFFFFRKATMINFKFLFLLADCDEQFHKKCQHFALIP